MNTAIPERLSILNLACDNITTSQGWHRKTEVWICDTYIYIIANNLMAASKFCTQYLLMLIYFIKKTTTLD